jgi:hypothetical protein
MGWFNLPLKISGMAVGVGRDGSGGHKTLRDDIDEFVSGHRSHGPMTGNATEPAWNGYCSQWRALASSRLSDGSRQRMPKWICSAWLR